MADRTSGSKALRRQAEVAAEHYLRSLGCVMTRRCFRTQFAKVDFFGADVVGKMPDGSHVYAQVTTGGKQAMSARRKKLEAVPWNGTDVVLLLQLVSTPGPRGSKLLWFRQYAYVGGDWFRDPEDVSVPKEWLKTKGLD